jgi:hypothetical protein
MTLPRTETAISECFFAIASTEAAMVKKKYLT